MTTTTEETMNTKTENTTRSLSPAEAKEYLRKAERKQRLENYEELFTKHLKVHTLVNGRTGKVIKIHEMIHIAPESFYEQKNEEISRDHKKGMVIHQEGVRLQEQVNQEFGSGYKKLAELLGMTHQSRPVVPHQIKDVSWENLSPFELKKFRVVAKVAALGIGLITSRIENAPEESRADVVDAVKDSFLSVLSSRANTVGPEKGTTKHKGLVGLVSGMLIDKRNDVAAAEALSTPESVSLVWGKAHAPGLIDTFIRSGYTLVTD